MSVKLSQPQNALSPTWITPFGIVILFKRVQSLNALSPILIIPSGITISPPSPVYLFNTLFSISKSFTSIISIIPFCLFLGTFIALLFFLHIPANRNSDDREQNQQSVPVHFLSQAFPFRNRHGFHSGCAEQHQHKIRRNVDKIGVDDKQIKRPQQHAEISVSNRIAAGTEWRHQCCSNCHAGYDIVRLVLSGLPYNTGDSPAIPPASAIITSKKLGLVRASNCSVGSLIGDSRK